MELEQIPVSSLVFHADLKTSHLLLNEEPSSPSRYGSYEAPGKTGLSFDVILGRLQGELQKSRETGAELNMLTGTMSKIHDTLGGNLVRLSAQTTVITYA